VRDAKWKVVNVGVCGGGERDEGTDSAYTCFGRRRGGRWRWRWSDEIAGTGTTINAHVVVVEKKGRVDIETGQGIITQPLDDAVRTSLSSLPRGKDPICIHLKRFNVSTIKYSP
jgi:hypothetical protein